MIRLVETLDLFNVRRGRQTIDLDVALPAEGHGEGADPDVENLCHWLIPAVFLNKRPIAPDLEVRDSTGSIVSVPTMQENHQLTLRALELMHAHEYIDLDAHPQLRAIVSDIVSKRPVMAEVAGIQLRERVAELPDYLNRILHVLTDQFLLWIPARGFPGSTHHFSIQRRQHREIPPILPPKGKTVEVEFDMAIGPTTVVGQAALGRRTFDRAEGLERLLSLLGLAPISFAQEIREACRVSSYHVRLSAPQDFVVRGVRLARIMANSANPDELWLEELEDEPDSSPHQTIQGHGSEMAHINCVDREDHSPLLVEALLGIRDGLTTLWALAVVLTAGLLWIFEHNLDPASGGGHLEVAAAILLLGPALAAAWAVRSDEGDLLRNVLSGTRQLLMASAILSVAAALALIGYVPFEWSRAHALEWYSAVSYAIAVIVVISWSITRRSPWFVYQHFLNSPKRNLWATALLAGLAGALVIHTGLPHVAVGAGLALLGLGLAVVSANRLGAEMEAPRPFAPLAGMGATVAFLAAGCFLGFYDDVLHFSLVRYIVLGCETLLAIRALALIV